MRKIIAITAGILVAWLVLGWFVGSWIGIDQSRIWLLRAAMWLTGIGAAAFVIWFFWSRRQSEKAPEPETVQAGTDDIGSLIREASARLPGSRGRLGSLPVIFLVGETKSGKTSAVVNSGTDAELLAGQVFQDSGVIPTRAANLWFSKGAVFVEAAGRFLDDPGVWAGITHGVQPRGLGSALSSGSAAPSAALVTVDAESMLRPGAAENLSAVARRIRARLTDISRALGVNLPVYVLFTRADRIPFFPEFTRNMTEAEVLQVLGATLPIRKGGEGVYAQQETDRLTTEFEKLFRSLCDFRPTALSREFDTASLPGVYEFPRELRKIRPLLVQFLVDLCRPSQLTVGPFLRGFYFSGVRPKTVTDAASPAAQLTRPQEIAGAATTLFRVDGGAPVAGMLPNAPAPGSRRVPQWIFLSNFFHYLLLGDQSAKTASGESTRIVKLRRLLLASAAVLCVLWSIALAVSFAQNRAVERNVRNAAADIRGTEASVASVDSLRRLELLRQSLDLVGRYRREGAPLSFHWGLYNVDALYPYVRRIYFANFQRLLLTPTQNALVDGMRHLPASLPGPVYGDTYDSLKSYLITTTHAEKSTRAYLSPVLTGRWSASQHAEGERVTLARRQFDFYSDELRAGNPFSSDNDAGAIDRARRYLSQFEGFERVYAAMLADASRDTQPINFNRKFAGSEETIVDAYDVPGPYTKQGWDLMRRSLKNPDVYFSGEVWVLGDRGLNNVDREKLGAQLATRYNSDFVRQWRTYLKSATVKKYANIQDAAKKLAVISGNESTLLELFSLASQNTAVEVPEVANVFQPVQSVLPPASVDRFIAPANQAYMSALLQLQVAVEAAAAAPELNDAAAQPTLTSAAAARIATKQIAQSFRGDPEGHIDATVAKLMEDPITNVEALLRRMGPDELNGRGKDFCGQYRKLLTKYPFNSSSAAPQATIADVNAIFRPGDGALWTFYDSALKKVLPKQGAQYAPAPDGALALNPAFVKYFNDAAAISDSWYAGGTPEPHFVYTIRPLPADDIQGVGFQIDGQALEWLSGAAAAPKQFNWQARDRNEAKATVRFGGGADISWANKQGLWSVFQFFGEAENRRLAGAVETLEWVIRIGKDPAMVAGKPLTVRVELSMPGGPPVFQKGFFSKLGCVADVAK